MDTLEVLKAARFTRVNDGQQAALMETCTVDKWTLLLVWPQLGDFDPLEYAWWIERDRAQLESANIQVRAVGIGDRTAGEKFCHYTGFPANHLHVDPTASVHRALGLYKGLTTTLPGTTPAQDGYLNLLLMCMGIGSPGTLKEVFRGYAGDKQAPQLIADNETIKAAPLPALKGEVFKAAGGKGFQRPFELATLRLRNMTEVLSNWRSYVTDAAYLTQRGATFLLSPGGQGDSKIVYEWRDRNILGFAENMSDPLSFLGNYVPTYRSASPTARPLAQSSQSA